MNMCGYRVLGLIPLLTMRAALTLGVSANDAPVETSVVNLAVASPLKSFYISPTQIVWQSDAGISNAERLLSPAAGQAILKEPQPPCVLSASAGKPAGLLLDFGREIHGSVELFTPMTAGKTPPTARIRMGESVSEAISDIDKHGTGNDHADP